MMPTPNSMPYDLLGCQASKSRLFEALAHADQTTPLRTIPSAKPGETILAGEGVCYTLISLPADAAAPESAVGLQGIALYTRRAAFGSAWPGVWPAALPGEQTTRADLIGAFGPPQAETPNLAIFESPADGPRPPCGVLAQFDEHAGLQSIMLMHLSPTWRPLPDKITKPWTPGPG